MLCGMCAVSRIDSAATVAGNRHGIDRAARRPTPPVSRGALRTLQMTTPIAKNPTRVFPHVIEELADKYGDAPALLSDREQLQLSRACRALEPLRALGARAGHRQGRHGLPDDAEPAGIPGDLARRHARRRRGRAAQHQSDRRALAHCINVVEPQAHHRRRRTARRPCKTHASIVTSAPRSGCMATARRRSAAHRPRDRKALRRPARGTRTPPR